MEPSESVIGISQHDVGISLFSRLKLALSLLWDISVFYDLSKQAYVSSIPLAIEAKKERDRHHEATMRRKVASSRREKEDLGVIKVRERLQREEALRRQRVQEKVRADRLHKTFGRYFAKLIRTCPSHPTFSRESTGRKNCSGMKNTPNSSNVRTP